jgi:hypothetical protein
MVMIFLGLAISSFVNSQNAPISTPGIEVNKLFSTNDDTLKPNNWYAKWIWYDNETEIQNVLMCAKGNKNSCRKKRCSPITCRKIYY